MVNMLVNKSIEFVIILEHKQVTKKNKIVTKKKRITN